MAPGASVLQVALRAILVLACPCVASGSGTILGFNVLQRIWNFLKCPQKHMVIDLSSSFSYSTLPCPRLLRYLSIFHVDVTSLPTFTFTSGFLPWMSP